MEVRNSKPNNFDEIRDVYYGLIFESCGNHYIRCEKQYPAPDGLFWGVNVRTGEQIHFDPNTQVEIFPRAYVELTGGD